MLLLQSIDQRWKEHLERVDRMKEGIHLRGYAQKDPLIEYKKEAFAAFQQMNAWVREETVEKLVKIRIVDQQSTQQMLQERPEFNDEGLVYAGAEDGPSDFFEKGQGARETRPGPAGSHAAARVLLDGRAGFAPSRRTWSSAGYDELFHGR